ncbi:MAG: LLM class flavin-dependent oxidoreductase [Solirubrobacterales bacterium]
MPRLSVLDLSPVAAGRGEAAALRETLELADAAERLGYHRFWLAEHHGGEMVASSAPEIMIAAIGAATQRIRVGSGGIMLPNHTPLHVAEQFKVLEALYPGRIDLGIGRAPGTDHRTALALRRGNQVGGADLPEMLAELLAYSGLRGWPEGHPFAPVRAAPADAPLPPIFLLGSSDFSARLAAAAGLGFAFAGQINPAEAVATTRLYREQFQPSPELAEPYAILGHNAICAETNEQAQRLAAPSRVAFRNLRSGHPTPLPTVEDAAAVDRPQRPPENGVEGLRMVVGTPAYVREVYDELLSRSGADELMLMAGTHGIEDRIRSYELIAEAFGLGATA